MSNEIYPTLPGLKIDVYKTPIFSTLIQQSTSGKSITTSLYINPLWQYDLSYSILRDDSNYNELKTLMGFYMNRQGGYDSFLFLDPSDNNINGQEIGLGNGNNTQFQLIREYGGFIEPQQDIIEPVSGNPPLNIYLDGILDSTSNYNIDYFQSGIVSFNDAVPLGTTVSADFSFYKRVRFLEFSAPSGAGSSNSDSFGQFAHNLWSLGSITLVTCR
jgi:uncharacterized protein (TIGR02217 family)